jgi:hypothetical protein
MVLDQNHGLGVRDRPTVLAPTKATSGRIRVNNFIFRMSALERRRPRKNSVGPFIFG